MYVGFTMILIFYDFQGIISTEIRMPEFWKWLRYAKVSSKLHNALFKTFIQETLNIACNQLFKDVRELSIILFETYFSDMVDALNS